MFTGITHGRYSVTISPGEHDITVLEIDLGEYGSGIEIGASVSVNGVCLTVVAIDGDRVSLEVGAETSRISNLSELSSQDHVNVERSFRVGQEVGGHILSGHIADMVEVTAFNRDGNEAQFEFRVPERWRIYLLPKGFVALNGCSLTIADFDRVSGVGTINLIPETIRRTTFDCVKIGDYLNLEVDSQTQTIVETVRTLLTDKEFRKGFVES